MSNIAKRLILFSFFSFVLQSNDIAAEEASLLHCNSSEFWLKINNFYKSFSYCLLEEKNETFNKIHKTRVTVLSVLG